MSIQITREEFEALRPFGEGRITTESDNRYFYETFLDEDGEEIAFSTTSRELAGEVDEADDYLVTKTTYTLIHHD